MEGWGALRDEMKLERQSEMRAELTVRGGNNYSPACSVWGEISDSDRWETVDLAVRWQQSPLLLSKVKVIEGDNLPLGKSFFTDSCSTIFFTTMSLERRIKTSSMLANRHHTVSVIWPISIWCSVMCESRFQTGLSLIDFWHHGLCSIPTREMCIFLCLGLFFFFFFPTTEDMKTSRLTC